MSGLAGSKSRIRPDRLARNKPQPTMSAWLKYRYVGFKSQVTVTLLMLASACIEVDNVISNIFLQVTGCIGLRVGISIRLPSP